jgi:NADPH2:quinone reductase
MVKAIVIHEAGGPEVLKWEEVELGDPGPGQARIRHHAIGLNFVDVYYRTGLYKPAKYPFVPGGEGAGEVIAVGPGVSTVKPGDRVAYYSGDGAYAEERLISADRLIGLPDSIDYRIGAAMTLKGLTSQFLLRQTFRVEKGQTILFHAAAGGVGSIACQWANHLGATVIGTAGTDKVEAARANGCHHVIDYRSENFVERVKEITGGEKCHVVYDSVGKDAFPGSLDCLRPKGMWVLFGQSSGLVPPIEMSMLQQRGSLFATRPTLFVYAAKREDLEPMAADLLDVVSKGIVKIAVGQEFGLKDAAEAQSALEARKTTGATVLIP